MLARFRSLLPCVALLLLAGCAVRGSITLNPAAADAGSIQDILVASTRNPVDGSQVLSSGRSPSLSFYDFSVSVPPYRTPGTVTFPHGDPPDPDADFLTVAANRLGGASAFIAEVNAKAARLPPRDREVTVFVHGYNTTFAEGLYRQAQIGRDFGTRGISVNFAWPSAADFRAYAYDRESALFSRDGLENVLDALTRSNASRIIVVGHSMGAQVVMETLRQMAIRGAPAFFRKLGAVVLVAPDLDIDVFPTQARPLAKLDVPIYVFVSTRDLALRLSSLLRGTSARLGSISDVSQLRSLPIAVIDVSHLDPNNDPLQHFKAGSSPTMIALFAGMGSAGLQMFRDDVYRPGILEGGVTAISGLRSVVLSGPTQ